MNKVIAFVFAWILSTPVWADSTINNLGAGGAITGTEQIPMFQTANPAVTTTPNALKTFIAPTAANPTATASAAAINGSAATFMRSDGAPAVAKASNSVFGIVEVDNTTITAAAGVISTVNNGTVTSISSGCGSSTGGSAITTTGTISAVEVVNLQTGANYAIVNGDCGKLVDLSNGSAQTPTIAQAGSGGNFTSGWYADVCNIGAGTQTLTPATSTINGSATLPIIKGQCYRVVSDGTNYQAAGAGLFGTTGSGNLVYATSPTFVTPILGTPTSVTLNNSSDIIGGVTMTLGSDATGDMYYRAAGGALTRLAVCTGTNVLGASGGLPACVAQSGGGITVGTTTVTGGAAGNMLYTDGSLTQATTAWTYASNTLTNTQALAANTSGDGLILTNTTAASAGNQEFSPRIRLSGQGWKTNATAASQAVDWKIENQPVQGAANPSTNLVIADQINAAGYNVQWTMAPVFGNATGAAAWYPGSSTNNIGLVPYTNDDLILGSATTSYFRFSAFSSGMTGAAGPAIILAGGGITCWVSAAGSTNSCDTAISRGTTAATLQFGTADIAVPVSQITQVQRVVAGTSNTAGALWTFKDSAGTGTAASGGYSFQVAPAGSTGTAQNTFSAAMTIAGGTGAIGMPLLVSTSAAQTGTVCWSSSGGNLTVDATLACLSSLEELKDIHGPITGALSKVMALDPFWFTPINRPTGSDDVEQPGLGAHQVEAVDRRLVGYDSNGNLRGVRYMELVAVLVAAIKEQQMQINSLHRAP